MVQKADIFHPNESVPLRLSLHRFRSAYRPYTDSASISARGHSSKSKVIII